MIVDENGVELVLLLADDHSMVGEGTPLATQLRIASDPKLISIAIFSLGSVMFVGTVKQRKQDIDT